ncbi:MAG: hypothetical protein KatS3mg019_1567 [Fimbriimonadales bacterium]|nr:MAG: hypothetical protein KatS3mg019_1567 [Fimbriimonadales bacterium]
MPSLGEKTTTLQAWLQTELEPRCEFENARLIPIASPTPKPQDIVPTTAYEARRYAIPHKRRVFEKSVGVGYPLPMKRRYPHNATRTTLPVNTIYALLQRFCQLHPCPPKRGRPPKYPEPLILTLLLLGAREHASYRRLRFALARELLPDHPLPALGTLVYRFHHLTDERLHQLLSWLAQQGIAAEPATTETPCAFVDGTGVGYAGTFFAQYLRGAAVRRQRSHVKLVALGYWQGGRVWVAGLELGQAYADVGARRRCARTLGVCKVHMGVYGVRGCAGMGVRAVCVVGLVRVVGVGFVVCCVWAARLLEPPHLKALLGK